MGLNHYKYYKLLQSFSVVNCKDIGLSNVVNFGFYEVNGHIEDKTWNCLSFRDILNHLLLSLILLFRG